MYHLIFNCLFLTFTLKSMRSTQERTISIALEERWYNFKSPMEIDILTLTYIHPHAMQYHPARVDSLRRVIIRVRMPHKNHNSLSQIKAAVPLSLTLLIVTILQKSPSLLCWEQSPNLIALVLIWYNYYKYELAVTAVCSRNALFISKNREKLFFFCFRDIPRDDGK